MKLSRTFTALAATSALTLAACSNAQETADEVADNATEQASRAVESATNAAGSAADNAKDAASDTADATEQKYPDILSAELSGPDGTEYDIAVTVSSPYDSPDRYADGWRVLDEDGNVLAEHELAHDHANEQPFTRSRGPFVIPEGVAKITVEGHDQEHGYGGETITIDVPR